MAMRCGARGSHTAVNTLQAQKLHGAAQNLAQPKDFHKLPPFKVDLLRLHAHALADFTNNPHDGAAIHERTSKAVTDQVAVHVTQHAI